MKKYKYPTTHPLYSVLKGMKARCYDSKNKRYNRYGGRGIKICDEWKNNYDAFYEWGIKNGYKRGLSIDRINNDGDYEPQNCKWSTDKEQCRNRSTNVLVEYNGKTITLIELSEITNIPFKRLYMRYSRGDRGELLTRPLNQTKKKRGENNPTSKITEDIARDIKKRLREGEKQCDIARFYNVSKYLIFDIKRGKTWNWIK